MHDHLKLCDYKHMMVKSKLIAERKAKKIRETQSIIENWCFIQTS